MMLLMQRPCCTVVSSIPSSPQFLIPPNLLMGEEGMNLQRLKRESRPGKKEEEEK